MIGKCLILCAAAVMLIACQPAQETSLASVDAFSDSASPVPVLTSAEAQPAEPDTYLDDRSTSEQLVKSLYNALSRQEYLRAYSYFETGALPSFKRWSKGYEGSHDFRILIGTIVADPGAGNLYFRVPVAVQATNAEGEVEVFSGCYITHMAQPAVQATPPFRPLSIRSGTLKASDQPLEQSVPAACE